MSADDNKRNLPSELGSYNRSGSKLFDTLKVLMKEFSEKVNLSRNMRFPTMWYVRPTKAQTSLRICAV